MNIIIQNIPEEVDLKQWVEIPLKVEKTENSVGKVFTEDGKEYNAQIIDGVLYVLASVNKLGEIKGYFKPSDPPVLPDPFKFSNWILDDLSAIQPTFTASASEGKNYIYNPKVYKSTPIKFITEDDTSETSYVKLVQRNEVKQSFKYQSVIPELKINIEGKFNIYTEQDILPFEIRIYGGADNYFIHNLSMTVKEEVIIDNHKILGLDISYLGNGFWQTELVKRKNSPIQDLIITGSLLCRTGLPVSDSDRLRLLNLKARNDGRLVGKIV